MDRPSENKFPEYATVISNNPITGNDNVLEPDSGQKETGWLFKQQPPYEYMNWLHRLTYKWLQYFDSSINQFAPQEKPTADLGIRISGGYLKVGRTYQLVNQFDTTPVSAPLTNPRIDLYTLDRQTGGVNIYIGTEDASPAAPEILAQDLPICTVSMSVAMTEIKNEDITDIRYSYETVSPEVENAIVESGQTLDLSQTNQLSKAIFSAPFYFSNSIQISNNSIDSEHDIDISVGSVIDSTRSTLISFDSILTKRIDAAWTEGNNNGGFPTGITLTADTTYCVFGIKKTDGTADGGFDTSLSATNLLADASDYTYYKRLGYILTDSSSNIIAFHQLNDDFYLTSPYTYTNERNLVSTAESVDIKVPSIGNIISKVKHTISGSNAGVSASVLVSSLLEENIATINSSNRTCYAFQAAADVTNYVFFNGGYLDLISVNGQVRHRSSSGTSSIKSYITAMGWKDKRLD